MKEIKFEVSVETNKVNSRTTKMGFVQVDDDATIKEINEAVKEVANEIMYDMINWDF